MKKLLIRFSRWLAPVSHAEAEEMMMKEARIIAAAFKIRTASVMLTGWAPIPGGSEGGYFEWGVSVHDDAGGCSYFASRTSLGSAVARIRS